MNFTRYSFLRKSAFNAGGDREMFTRTTRYGCNTSRFLALVLCTAMQAWGGGEITKFTTGGSGFYTPGGPFVLLLQPSTYFVSDGTTWASGAGSFLQGSANVTRVSTVGNMVLYTLSPNTGTLPVTPSLGSGLVVFQDFDNGSNSAEGAFNAATSLILTAVAGSADAVLSGYLQLSSNPSDGFTGFEYFATPVCGTVPFTVTYHLDSGSWNAKTFKSAFSYTASGQVNLPFLRHNLTTLYSFHSMPDGQSPRAGLTLGTSGVLYGTTFDGGTGNAGTFFQLNPPVSACGGWTDTVLYDFGSDGTYPSGLTLGPNGEFYGTTNDLAGGGGGQGGVFELMPPTTPGGSWTENVLHNFAYTDGAEPFGGVAIDRNGALYGTTFFGGTGGPGPGCDAGSCGVVFRLTPPTKKGDPWGFKVLYNFKGPDGGNPLATVVIGPGGVLYGTTYNGGAFGQGAVFSLTPPAAFGASWTETVLYSFAGPFGSTPDGANPEASLLIGKNGALYGTTSAGGTSLGCGAGAGCGNVFELTPPGAAGGAWTETVLYNFSGANDGGSPAAPLLAGNHGELFGTTVAGGASSVGTAFVLKPPTSPGGVWTEQVLHSFTGRGDGSNPFGPLISANGLLWGMTNGGGASGYGTVFELKP